MTTCSAQNCKQPGLLFDGSTVGLIACKEHEEKWRGQMIDLGVSCLNNHSRPSLNPMCHYWGCQGRGFYVLNGVGYCPDHASVGALCSYITMTNDVIKMCIQQCSCGHEDVCVNNADHDCWCGEKLKNNK